ncbi:GNAT family N-acetyltransferase [Vibrio gallicus]|uniref:GNAT family N-acetyltransferase n=1 Tax=Vibrio gallicus TaxID=190897 RepID=UPI0021C3D4F0|nr:GNAT family N-acetyltransferase [Vibrio gallicus]
MIVIEKLNKSHHKAVLAIQLSEQDVRFASTPHAFVTDTTRSIEKFVIRVSSDIVGFFKLDLGYAQHYNFCSKASCGLRTLALDTRHQAKGLGAQFMKTLPSYLAEHYSGFEFIYLTVNCKNLAAKVCYQKGGFDDTGKLYLGGPSGPQHIMRINIPLRPA